MPARQPVCAATTAKPTLPTTLHEAIQLATSAAATRASEAQRLYSKIADMLEEYRQEENKTLPTHLRSAFKAFCDDFFAVTQRHIDAHVRGNPRPPPPYMASVDSPKTPPTSTPPLADSTVTRSRSASRPGPYSPPISYAEAVSKPRSILKDSSSTSLSIARPQARKMTSPPDNRLFVRLDISHKAKTLPGYTVLNKLRALGIGQHIQDIQTTKTGFALKPSSPESQTTLEASMADLYSFFGEGCKIERASEWTSYRITAVPRNITLLNDQYEPTQSSTTAEILASALTEAVGTAPANITQTPASVATPHDYSSSWIARFPINTPALPRNILLLGARASIKYLPKRTTTIQCKRCFQWHNDRICARTQRCRLCGSTVHTEPNHPACSPSPHSCPPRCLHCHGPHPADSLECLLRPNPKKTKLTKQQTAQIRQTCAAARIQLCQAASCQTKSQPDSSNQASREATLSAILIPGTQYPTENASTAIQDPSTQDSIEATPPVTQVPNSQPIRTNPIRTSKASIYKKAFPSLSSSNEL